MFVYFRKIFEKCALNKEMKQCVLSEGIFEFEILFQYSFYVICRSGKYFVHKTFFCGTPPFFCRNEILFRAISICFCCQKIPFCALWTCFYCHKLHFCALSTCIFRHKIVNYTTPIFRFGRCLKYYTLLTSLLSHNNRNITTYQKKNFIIMWHIKN